VAERRGITSSASHSYEYVNHFGRWSGWC